MKPLRSLVVASSLLLASQAQAATFNINPVGLAQTQFNALSDDLAAISWVNPGNSAEAHSAGIIPVGVQVALESSFLSIDNNAAHWALVGAGNLPGNLPVPKLRVSAGIPFGLDVGVMYASIPSSNVELSGFEARMAFGNYIPVPFVEANIRYHQSALTGIPDMEITTSGFAAMIGANLPIVKPYIEFGTVTSTSTPSGALATAGLVKYSKDDTTTTIGAKLELAFLILNVEQSKIGDKDLTTIKIGLEF